jgi:ABC-type amino acid transport substrate-binding protein
MAGVKGKGGVKGRSGGARVGAGRKPKAQSNVPSMKPVALDDMSMLEMLQAVALGRVPATTLQVRAAIAAAKYMHAPKVESAKKGGQSPAIPSGKFAPSAPPLRVVGKG